MTDSLSLDKNTNPSPAHVLRSRNFRLLWIGEGISLLGDQFYLIALPWLVLSLTGNPLAVGTVLAMAGIPRALFMLVVGALTDRFTPRKLMINSNLARMTLPTSLAPRAPIANHSCPWFYSTLANTHLYTGKEKNQYRPG